MARFSRTTVFEACCLLGQVFTYHGQFEDLVLGWELDELEARNGAIHERCRNLFRYIRDNPEAAFDGRLLSDLVVEEAAQHTSRSTDGNDRFRRSLQRDGYSLVDGTVRRTLPDAIHLPAADDEVHVLLDRQGLTTTKGHLDQAIRAHAQGHWAAANSQLRTALESLFDEIAPLVDTAAERLNPGEARRQFLSNTTPPFLSRELNEWSDDGKSFVNGLFKRLHPQGSHPGLSDEDDSTFRLHLVLLVARLFLRRLSSSP